MMDFLDALEARLPNEVERRALVADRRRVARAIDRALAPAPRRTMRTRVWVGLAAAAVLVAASAAAAISHARGVAVSVVPATRTEAAPVIAPVTTNTVVFEPAMSVDDLPRATPAIAAPATDTETAAEMFARANHMRQSGDADGAIGLYQKLEQRFPSSSEAAVAHVSLGRVLLDRDARGAIAEYDAYLATGTFDLREEALVGRARAFGKLGQAREEKRAWQALLAEHPDSLHATRAKERIAALP